MSDVILDVDHLTMRFGGLTAVNDVSFQVKRGTITAVIGPNGAGKTTVFNAISALYMPTEGVIRFAGKAIQRMLTNHTIARLAVTALATGTVVAVAADAQGLWNAMLGTWVMGQSFDLVTGLTRAANHFEQTATWPFAIGTLIGAAAAWKQWTESVRTPDLAHRHGIARTFQNIRLFKGMTCLENILTPQDPTTNYNLVSAALRLPGRKRTEAKNTAKAMALLQLIGLEQFANATASSLPYGAQRRLEIARALASDPKLLLLDEPAAGMNESESADLMDLIRGIRNRGVTILLIEHDMNVVMGMSDTIIVLDHGEKIADGSPELIKKDRKVIEAYLGASDDAAPETPAPGAPA